MKSFYKEFHIFILYTFYFRLRFKYLYGNIREILMFNISEIIKYGTYIVN